jgi:hypothetical protein
MQGKSVSMATNLVIFGFSTQWLNIWYYLLLAGHISSGGQLGDPCRKQGDLLTILL